MTKFEQMPMAPHGGEIYFAHNFCRRFPIDVRLNHNEAEAFRITPIPLLTPLDLKFISLINLSQLHLQYAKICFVHNFCTWLQIEVRLTQNEAEASHSRFQPSRNPCGAVSSLRITLSWAIMGPKWHKNRFFDHNFFVRPPILMKLAPYAVFLTTNLNLGTRRPYLNISWSKNWESWNLSLFEEVL